MNIDLPPPKPLAPPPDTKRPFVNPYAEYNGSAANQILIFVDKADKDLLRMIRTGAQGTFSTTACLLIKQLCNELRAKQITEPQHREDFEQFITNIRIVDADDYECLVTDAAQRSERSFALGLRDSSTGRAVAERSESGQHDNGTTAGVRSANPPRASKPRVVPSKVKRGKTADSGKG